MKKKSKVRNIMANFRKLIHTQFQTPIKMVSSDNGREFIALKDFFLENGITHQSSIPYTPQQNCYVEHKH